MTIYREPFEIESYIDLDGIIARLEREHPDRILPIGFNEPHSYRGYYDELAFQPVRDIPVSEVLEAARSALGATYEGWKGGEYTMTGSTTCWLSERGCSHDNKIGPLLLELLLAQSPADVAKGATT